MSHELHTGAPVRSATPVAPEKRSLPDDERMQEDAHLARLCRRPAIPLTLLAQLAGTTTANAGTIPYAQASIDFATLLLDTKLLAGWTMECPIWLDREIVA
jgi:hypothetical protein